MHNDENKAGAHQSDRVEPFVIVKSSAEPLRQNYHVPAKIILYVLDWSLHLKHLLCWTMMTWKAE